MASSTKKSSEAKESKAKDRLQKVDPLSQPTEAAFVNRAEGTTEDGRVPRYVRNDPARIEQLLQLGYEFDKDDDGEKIIIRDMVKMSISVDKYEERLEMKNQKTNALNAAGSAQFQDTANRLGVSATDKTSRRVAAPDAED